MLVALAAAPAIALGSSAADARQLDVYPDSIGEDALAPDITRRRSRTTTPG